MDKPANVKVPDGHLVRTFRHAIDPFVARTPGGTLFADAGARSDDPTREIDSLLTSLEEKVTPHPVSLAARTAYLSDLFAPSNAPLTTLPSAALVYLQPGCVDGIDSAGLDRIVSRLRALASRTTFFVCMQASADLVELVTRLRAAQLEVRIAVPDGTVLAEVTRPDGTVATLIVARPLEQLPPPVAQSKGPAPVPTRAPRLDTLLLACVRDAGPAPAKALEAYLRERTAPFFLFSQRGVDGQFAVAPRDFGGQFFFVAYGDERSLHRAAREIGLAPGSFALASMTREMLMPWALGAKMGVALCVFDWKGQGVWHVPLEPGLIARLAR